MECMRDLGRVGRSTATPLNPISWLIIPPPMSHAHTGRVAQACATTLSEMNPLVDVCWRSGSAQALSSSDDLTAFDAVLLSGTPLTFAMVRQVDAACSKRGVKLFVAECRGVTGWAFANLGEHSYVVEVREKDGCGGGHWAGECMGCWVDRVRRCVELQGPQPCIHRAVIL